MSDSVSRRDWIRTVGAIVPALPAVSALGAAPPRVPNAPDAPDTPPPIDVRAAHAPGDIVALSSTSDVFVPARGRSFMKFSFDFPEPSVAFGAHRFGFMVFTAENAYGLDRARMRAEGDGDALRLTCDGFVWAGGQETAPGSLVATFRRAGDTIEWDVVVEMPQPVKTVTTVIRDVPRGRVSLGGGAFADAGDGDVLAGYTFGAGDLHGGQTPTSITTPIAAVQAGDGAVLALSSLDDRVRPKRFYFQAGERAYRVEAVHEHDAWRDDRRVVVPRWRLLRAASLDDAMRPHVAHVERAFGLRRWEERSDVPPWMRDVALVVTLHGMHYTGFVFNDYARQLEILRWIATQIPASRVLAFLAAWDGRYYWDYPNYAVPARMGGEAGFRRLVSEAQRLGFRMMPMFGANAANVHQPAYGRLAAAITRKIDGNAYDLDWVDWNNDRHQDGWLAYMNLGADAWRTYLEGRIAETIERFGVDAYFLDIVGGHVNSTTGDMHAGTVRLVRDLRARFPRVAAVGEMPYDALHGVIPMYQAGGSPLWRTYSRFFQHLSAPAPGRGSSGVHEWGFGRFDPATLGLSPNAIPTLQVVDDTFTRHRDTMAAIVAAARARAGLG